jgi:hypothetical protein
MGESLDPQHSLLSWGEEGQSSMTGLSRSLQRLPVRQMPRSLAALHPWQYYPPSQFTWPLTCQTTSPTCCRAQQDGKYCSGTAALSSLPMVVAGST